jgi:hypothetical protein
VGDDMVKKKGGGGVLECSAGAVEVRINVAATSMPGKAVLNAYPAQRFLSLFPFGSSDVYPLYSTW